MAVERSMLVTALELRQICNPNLCLWTNVELTVKMVKKSRETALKASDRRTRIMCNTSCRQFWSVYDIINKK
jgi:hypothetical protein